MAKSYEEINRRIRKGKAVVVTAEEMIDIVDEKGAVGAAKEVDVVTTGTFGPMCSSSALLNVGHTTPRMKIQKAWFDGVPASGGIAAVDLFLGATSLPEDDLLNKVHPGAFTRGGGHVIESLVRGEEVAFKARAYGTDCYPRREFEDTIRLKSLPQATLLNPRNGYQNYNVAVNAYSELPKYTYLGILQPGLANANYCSAGQLSPLLNDPLYRTIGLGTRIFLGGGQGYVFYPGTQHAPDTARGENGVPLGGAGTLAVVGDLKAMSPDYLRGVSITGYGVSLAVGLGVPIPILDEDMARKTAVRDSEIFAPVVDYSRDYFANTGRTLGSVSYAQLRSGWIEVLGKRVKTASLSSYAKAKEIAELLKTEICEGRFQLTRPVAPLPGGELGAGMPVSG